jgi:hypothetical protein
MYSCILSFILSGTNNGIKDSSLVFTQAINSNLVLIPESKNCNIKSIDFFITNRAGNMGINFWDVRFQGINRDGALLRENAGDIKNIPSGTFGTNFQKDNILDFVLNSRKSQIKFDDGILLGGIRLISISYSFKKTPLSSTNVFGLMNINYE